MVYSLLHALNIELIITLAAGENEVSFEKIYGLSKIFINIKLKPYMAILSNLKSFKNNLNSIFQKIGFKIVRVKQDERPKTGEIEIKLENVQLKMHATNPLGVWYNKFPYFNSELKRLAELLKKNYPDSGIIDIGANIGDTYAILKSGFDTFFLCIEGDSQVFQYLKANLSTQNDVEIMNVYLGEKSGRKYVELEKEGWNTTIIPNQKSNTAKQIEFITLDEILFSKYPNQFYKLLKIDAEGFDTIILRGAIEFLKKTNPVIAFEYNRDNMDVIKENGIITLKLLNEIGYDQIFVYESQGCFIQSFKLGDFQLMEQLHEYSGSSRRGIFYFDLILFHKSDEYLAKEFMISERAWRFS